MHRGVVVLLVLNVIGSTLVMISCHHWFSVWVALEMNTLSILPILSYQYTPRSVESTVKYFLVQAFSAAMILNVALVQAWICLSWSVFQSLNVFTSCVLSMALALKLGLFPCHYWFPDVIQGVSFIQGLVLSTWQKIAPFVLMTYVISSLNGIILMVMGVISVLIGGWGGLNQVQVRKILAFSSISHVGWIFSVMYYSVSVSCVMFMVYVIINSGVFILGNELGLNTLSSLSQLVYFNSVSGGCLILSILSLGGLPPLTGFLIKFLALECLVNNGAFVSSVVLVGGSLISLFFYLRIAFNSSLVLFPQHSLSMFSWRSLKVFNTSFSVYGGVLGILISISLFGLACFPVLVVIFN